MAPGTVKVGLTLTLPPGLPQVKSKLWRGGRWFSPDSRVFSPHGPGLILSFIPWQNGEITMLGEITHLQGIIDDLVVLTADPHKLPTASEQVGKHKCQVMWWTIFPGRPRAEGGIGGQPLPLSAGIQSGLAASREEVGPTSLAPCSDSTAFHQNL